MKQNKKITIMLEGNTKEIYSGYHMENFIKLNEEEV